jgi:hypothetical protein
VFITWDEISGLTAFVDEQEFKQEQYVEVDYDSFPPLERIMVSGASPGLCSSFIQRSIENPSIHCSIFPRHQCGKSPITTCDPIGSIVSGKAKSSWSWYLNLETILL